MPSPPTYHLAAIADRFADRVSVWQDRRRSRRALRRLSRRQLKDMGVCSGQAFVECRKPFWQG
jgi:uncharacterized protein YjiS (DUF1127 family)